MTCLTPKQERFVAEYIRTGNASEAYRLSYNAGKMKPETVNRTAFALLQNAKIAARIDDLRAESAKIVVLTQAGILEKLMTVSEAAMALDENGMMARPEAAIRALELLGKHVGLWPKDGAVQINIGDRGSFESALSKVEFLRVEGGIARTEEQMDILRDRCIGVLYARWRAGGPLPEYCSYGGFAMENSEITDFEGTMSLMDFPKAIEE